MSAARDQARTGATAAPDDTKWLIGAAAVGVALTFLPLLVAAIRRLIAWCKKGERT